MAQPIQSTHRELTNKNHCKFRNYYKVDCKPMMPSLSRNLSRSSSLQISVCSC
ncbi:CLUMA_CG020615, isoform A [Clunio marinus]|uniref:CLUMA_CG020615, isoform A n=1 Tax=Clunio marinus TaxID=568069 RepID=A0A1J1J9G8_9DIPT|nr:CLUMA_CG020615, isoform A [Clunio marinus]